MITEDYVSFEVAKLLKEKGFDEATNRYYNAQYDEIRTVSDTFMTYWNNEEHVKGLMMEDAIAIPTLQMACKWLREVHNLFIFPFPQMNTNKFWTEVFQLSNNQEWENLYCESIDLQDYPTYEKAVEAALKYALENLI